MRLSPVLTVSGQRDIYMQSNCDLLHPWTLGQKVITKQEGLLGWIAGCRHSVVDPDRYIYWVAHVNEGMKVLAGKPLPAPSLRLIFHVPEIWKKQLTFILYDQSNLNMAPNEGYFL